MLIIGDKSRYFPRTSADCEANALLTLLAGLSFELLLSEPDPVLITIDGAPLDSGWVGAIFEVRAEVIMPGTTLMALMRTAAPNFLA